jgi:hypothetical protein
MSTPPAGSKQNTTGTDFLNLLFGQCPPDLYVLLWALRDKGSAWLSVGQLDRCPAGLFTAEAGDVYYGVAPSPQDFGPHQRCLADQVSGIIGLWADIDIRHKTHKRQNLPATMGQAHDLAGALGIPPTVRVDSGHGLQCLWLFERPWLFRSSAERQQAQDLARRFHVALQARAKARGWEIDNVSDFARVLRLPGTWNCKDEGAAPVPVQVLVQDGPRYDVGDLLALLPPDGYEDLDRFNTGYKAERPTNGEALTPAELARRYVARMPEAVSRKRGHQALWAVAQVLYRGFAPDLTDEQARPILDEYNRRCLPPWSEKELLHKIDQAKNKSRLPLGYIINRDRRGHERNGQQQQESHQGEGQPPPSSAARKPMGIRRIPMSQLRSLPAAEKWLLRGLIPAEQVTILSALPKAGKTTFLAHLLHALETGGKFCGLDVRKGKVVCITEESEPVWADRRDKLTLTDNAEIVLRPFRTKPRMSDWLAFLQGLEESLRADRADVLVIDTLSKVWPVQNENDASEVTAALMPLLEIAYRLRVTLLLVHHLRKSEGMEGTQTRGSGGITAAVDSILELRRFNASNRQDRRRALSCDARFDDRVDELVIELSDDGTAYHARGDRVDARNNELAPVIAELLPDHPPGMTWEEVKEAWPEERVPGRDALQTALRFGHDSGVWSREGDGGKGSPFRYWKPGDEKPASHSEGE